MERLLLIGSGEETYRRYGLEQMSERYEVVLISGNPLGWERPFVADAAHADVADPDAVRRAAADLRSRNRIGGVLTFDEAALEPAVCVARDLGVASPPEAVLACRDKYRQRQAFSAGAIPSPLARPADSVNDAEAAAGEIGYPVVVKPRRLAGSIAVRRADNPGDLRQAAAAALAAADPRLGPSGGVVIEEFMDGPEISVDSWVFDGAAQPIVLAHKRTGFPPFFEETGHLVPDQVDPELWNSVCQVVIGAHAVLGLTRLVTHTELRLTGEGPKIVEINGRLGGDLIPYLGYLASGQSLAAAAADIAMGNQPDLSRAWRRSAAIEFRYPDHDMTLGSVEFDAELARQDWVDRYVQLAPAMASLRLPPGEFMARAAMVIVTGQTTGECEQRLGEAAGMIRLRAAVPGAR